MNTSMKEHWNEIYSALDVDELTWYEEIPEPSINLLSKNSTTEIGKFLY